MSKDAKAAALRRRIAKLEAELASLREQLAHLESGQTVAQAAAGGDIVLSLWKAALGISRTRSSKRQCQVMWNRIPKDQRPDLDTALAALRAWNKCEEWTKDACAYAPGLHRWIDRRGWEDVPEGRPEVDPLAKYQRPVPKPAPAAEAPATEAEIRAFFESLKGPGKPPASPVQESGHTAQISQMPAETTAPGTISLTSSLLEDRPRTP